MHHRRSFRIAAVLGLAAATASTVARAQDPPGPKPVVAWPVGPLEVRVAFDAPAGADVAEGLVGRSIRFPGNDPYLDDPGAAGFSLRIAGATRIDDGRTLVLATDPHPIATTYTLPDELTPGAEPLSYDLNGVEASWYEGDGLEVGADPSWSGWWPTLDPRAASEATNGSAEHGPVFERIAAGNGTLTVRTLVALPEEATEATLRLQSDRPFEATLGFEVAASQTGPERIDHSEVTTEVFPGQPVELNVTIPTAPAGLAPLPDLRAWRIEGDEAIELDRGQHQLPWAPMALPSSADVPPPPYDLSGGDPARGREVFLSEVAKCSTCHQIAGQGGEAGPPLDKLAGAEPTRIYRDLADPSAWIDPEYVTYTVALADGRVVVGVVRAEGSDTLRVLDTDAKETRVARDEVEDLLPSSTSVMPVGLAGALGEKQVRDLIAYLRSPQDASHTGDASN